MVDEEKSKVSKPKTVCKNCEEKPRPKTADEIAHEEYLKKYDEAYVDVESKATKSAMGSGVKADEEATGKYWAQEEDELVKKYWGEGKGSSEISDAMANHGFYRTRLAVYKRLHTLGLRTTTSAWKNPEDNVKKKEEPKDAKEQ